MRWNEIPYDETASPEEKALEFDLQVEENARGRVKRAGIMSKGPSGPTTLVYGAWDIYSRHAS